VDERRDQEKKEGRDLAGSNWTCSFCNRPQTIVEGQRHFSGHSIRLKETKFEGELGIEILATACSNPGCGEVTLRAEFGTGVIGGGRFAVMNKIDRYVLRPQSAAKPQPDYVPAAIRADYAEACLVKDLSPKASATLARRCLQGMIRDFCGISKSRLFDEIKELRKQIDGGTADRSITHESVNAIDAIRTVGNIGAHMEKDVGLIVDIDPDEAKLLIELIEMLFEEWYIERHDRRLRLERIAALSEAKKGLKDATDKTGRSSEPN
jgi:hypothetical protein